MIAPHNNPAELSGHSNYFVGVGAVADDIAEVPDHIMFWRGCKNRFKCLKIRMNVGDHKCAHVGLAASVRSTWPVLDSVEGNMQTVSMQKV